MSKRIQKLSNRVLAMILAIVMVVGVLPVTAFAETASVVQTNLGDANVIVGEYAEFTVTTTANDDKDKMVLGYFDFNGGDWSAIESLQYKETQDGKWYDLVQGVPFGPADSGFPLSDATSLFRVKFKTAGTYSFSVSMKTADEDALELCALNRQVVAVLKPSEVSTNVDQIAFEAGAAEEFTFTTVANGYKDEYVYGKVDFSDWTAVDTLEYWDGTNEQWVFLSKDGLIGPAETGFQMTKTPIRVRVTFNSKGSYTCTVAIVKASDTNAELCKVEKQVTVEDTTAPTVTVTSGNPANWVKSAEIKVEAADMGGSGVAKVIYGTQNEADAATQEAKLDNGVYTINVTENGTYYIWAVDGSKNTSAVEIVVVDKIDNKIPTLDVVTNPNTWTNGVVSIDISAVDTSGVTVKYNTVENLETATVIELENGKAQLQVSDEYNGSYYIWAVDAAGNEATAIVAVQIDKTLPTVSIVTLPSKDWTNEDVVVEGTVKDNASGVTEVVFGTVENPEDATDVAHLDGANYQFTVTENGIYRVWSKDFAGNFSDSMKIEVQNIDKIAPAVDSIEASNSWEKGDVVVTVKASDNLSGVAKVVFAATDAYSKELPMATEKDGSYVFTITACNYNDFYYVWAVDQAGNVSEVKSVKLTMDNTAPTVNTIAANPSDATNKNVTISCIVEDNLSGVSKVVYNTTDVYSDDLKTLDLIDDGTYSLVITNETQQYNVPYYVWVVDNAGNKSDVASVTIFLDITAPVVDTAVASPAVATNGDVTVTGTVSDVDSGVVKVVYSTNETYGVAPKEAVLNEDGTSYSFDVSNDKEFKGNYYIWAVDAAGNHSEAAKVAIHIDTTAAVAEVKIKEKLWKTFLETITWGLYSNKELIVTISADDGKNGSGVESVSYIICDTAKSREELKAVKEWQNYVAPFAITEEQRLIVYVRVIDQAGNPEYYNSDGVILDKTEAEIHLTYNGAADIADCYNGDVTIGLSVVDSKVYSGIKSIEYWVTTDDVVTKTDTLYSFGYDGKYVAGQKWEIFGSDVAGENGIYDEIPSYGMLKKSWSGEFVVSATNNNSSKVVVKIVVKDNAGNESVNEFTLDIDETAPAVEVEYTDEGEKFNECYFDGNRTAKITVTERDNHFVAPNVYINEAAAEGDKNYIRIIAMDANGAFVEFNPVIEWIPTKNASDPDKSQFTATIEYNVDANYTFEMQVMDKASNVNDKYAQPYAFTVDKLNPEGSLSIDGYATWEKIIDTLTFGIFSKDHFDVIGTANDATSPIKVEYYVVYGADAPAILDVELIESWIEISQEDLKSLLTVKATEQFVVYLKITDKANHVHYVSTDGAIVENVASGISLNVSDPVVDNGVEDVFGYYNEDVIIDVSVVDESTYSGIKTIEYWVTKDGEKTQGETLYSFGYDGKYVAGQKWEIFGSDVAEENGIYDKIPSYGMLKKSWTGAFTVSAADNNSCNVVVTVQVTDNAGNVSSEEIKLDIDYKEDSSPAIEVTYQNDGQKFNDKYFNDKRTATITITERAEHFVTPNVYINEDVAEGDMNYIHITATDAAGNGIDFAADIQWETTENEQNANLDTHTATIVYNMDANYTFDIKVTDKATNVSGDVTADETDSPFAFTIDTVAPNGTITLTTKVSTRTWDAILSALTFGWYDAKRITVTTTANDQTSPVKVEYYKVSGESAATALSEDELNQIVDWTVLVENEKAVVEETNVLTIRYYEQFVVYLKLTDNAGHVTYLRSGAGILDNLSPLVHEITVREGQFPVNGLFTGDVILDVAVAEQVVDGVYSGLKNVRYEVYNYSNEEDQQLTQSGTLMEFKLTPDDEQPINQTDLVREFTTANNKTEDGVINEAEGIENYIVVDAELNNSNNVVVWVIAEDNAGNQIRKSIDLKIDITAPRIVVEYDNNNSDSGHYYKADRTATIKIVERNFDPSNVVINITNTDEVIPEIPTEWKTVDADQWDDMIPAEWHDELQEGNGDRTVHIATIHYGADGDYVFSIECADQAGWTCGNESEEEPEKKFDYPVTGGVNAFAFTIDKTLPVIRVTSDNDQAQNGNYFKNFRTLTVTIIEHNFPLDDIQRVEFVKTAARGGVAPNVSWSHNGDTHIATFKFNTDGDYTFDVSMKDLAGNQSAAADFSRTVAGKDFIIDTTYDEMVTIGGVETHHAYGYGVPVIPTIDITDINLDTCTVTLEGIQKDKKISLTKEVNELLSVGSGNISGIFDIFEVVRDLDGIYTLHVIGYDKAGNIDEEEVVFTVNRFGSVYVYEDYLMDLVVNGGAYVKTIENDLIIEEYNADKLLAGTVLIEITRDGKPLENVIWKATPEIDTVDKPGDSGWYQYKYTISAKNFAADGVYKITASSKDATGNASENNRYEEMSITFRVDSTPAEISSVVGLEEAIINATEKLVKYTIFDAVGLKAVRVYLDNQLLYEVLDFDGDVYNYTGELTLSEKDVAQEIRIEVEDLAGNITDTADETFSSAYEFNSKVTVSTKFFVRWYADKPLFYGSIGAMALAVIGLGVYAASKSRKKDEEEASTK